LRSVTQSLLRQGVFAVAGVAVVGAVHAGMSVAPRAPIPSKQISEAPIVVPSIVVAEAAKPAVVAATTPPADTKPQRLACAIHCGPRPIAKKTPLSKPAADPAPALVDVAFVAPPPEGPSLGKRLFAPVGFVRDRVGQLISWL
jgi:hypothetical protein